MKMKPVLFASMLISLAWIEGHSEKIEVKPKSMKSHGGFKDRKVQNIKAWGIDGTGKKSRSGKMSGKFPGPSGKYKVSWVVVLEADGRPSYKLKIGSKTLGSGKYPWPKGNKGCADGPKAERHTMNFGTMQINEGDEIVIEGKSTFECSPKHGAYTLWEKLIFEGSGSGGSSKPKEEKLDKVRELKAKSATEDEVVLQWKSVKNAKSYEIFNGSKEIGSTKNTEFKIEDLKSNTEYQLSVRAKGDDGSSDKVSLKVKTKGALPVKPEKVSDLKAKSTTGDKIVLQWKSAKNAETYDIYDGNKRIGNTKSTEYTIENLKSNTEYKLSVVSKGDAGSSEKVSIDIKTQVVASTSIAPHLSRTKVRTFGFDNILGDADAKGRVRSKQRN